MSYLIYVADDEKAIRDLIESFLIDSGYRVKSFSSGDELLAEFETKEADLIILDVNMPGTDGFSACQSIRKNSDVPIILLTARDTDADYITGFTIGCDDYFTKPFSPVKLTMRVKVMLNRLNKSFDKTKFNFGDIEINTLQKTVASKNKEFNLTNTEFLMLSYMVENSEKAISREELLKEIWGYDNELETRVTDDTAKRLRKKLIAVGTNVIIETVWGFGFKLKIKQED